MATKLKKTGWLDAVQTIIDDSAVHWVIELRSFLPVTQRKFSRLFKRGIAPDRAAAIILRYVAQLDRAWQKAHPEVCGHQVCARCGKQFTIAEWDDRHEPHDKGCPCFDNEDSEPEDCIGCAREPVHADCCPECK